MKGLLSSLNENSALCIIMIVIVNCLFKQAYVILWFKTAAKDTAMVFYYWVFPHHSLPFTIILDWGTQFVSYFWQALCEILGIKTQLSTAFHPQTDRQTERINFTIEMYLQMYVDFMQNDWVWWCSSAEFIYNNYLSEVTNCISFFVNSEQHLCMSTESFIVNTTLRDCEQAQQQVTLSFAIKMNLINDILQKQMTQTQTVYKKFANCCHDHVSVIKQEDII